MKRRRPIDVWPAFADLMTILSVPGLFLALGLIAAMEDKPEVPEDVRNLAMFKAIQEVQRTIDVIAVQGGLQFSEDQTLLFGDDLVTFDLNSTSADWKAGGPERLHRFCTELRLQLMGPGSTPSERSKLFSVEVEGHTDATSCPADRNCNWDYSSRRATAFMTMMRDESICPGGKDFDLKPIGFADTKPLAEKGSPARATRRIALRIVPNYGSIIDTVEG